MLTRIRAAVPGRYKAWGRRGFLRIWSRANAGSSVWCPCCGRSFRRFAPFHARHDQCPGCGSLTRHRALLLYMRDVLRLPSCGGDVLHVAPEVGLGAWLAVIDSVRYVSVDIDDSSCSVHADITDLPFADASFDLIVCLHVLEHVVDDRQAIRELFRVLRPGGTGVIQVPPSPLEATFEDVTVNTPVERQRVFGQYDHVRICGADYRLRLEAAGFDVSVEDYVQRLDPDTRQRLGLLAGEPFYVCAKPTAARTPHEASTS